METHVREFVFEANLNSCKFLLVRTVILQLQKYYEHRCFECAEVLINQNQNLFLLSWKLPVIINRRFHMRTFHVCNIDNIIKISFARYKKKNAKLEPEFPGYQVASVERKFMWSFFRRVWYFYQFYITARNKGLKRTFNTRHSSRARYGEVCFETLLRNSLNLTILWNKGIWS